MARKYPTTEDNLCTNAAEHGTHICSLIASGRADEARNRSRKARFACFNCGARADEEKSLCNPTPLAGEA
ncbi:hypothetical protein [Geoalkalibacter halelectricus]|uniref:Uncharacterized protein n=1 Tax=Geoalkalibacter halelectricus TaxID=2847045 RepID=A0ABY5ZPP2_9BACT|nr:hypothetical protein [Geoalkalibacter halelectricus]MDO3376893.1 hypothetical protein [Geoalkalibacter halelectricus]UWZ81117.1 hypothetical protein L9S41_06900 [Geoalkalibacter halelectricus]